MRVLPPNPLLHRGRHLALSLLVGALCAGCAKFPDEDVAGTGKRLIFTVTFAGDLVDDRGPSPYFYFVALRLSKDPNPPGRGPQPAVRPPYANGFIAERATHFVQWDPLRRIQPTEYRLFRFLDPVPEVEETPNQAFLTTIDFANGVEPVDRQTVEQGDRTIRFELFLSQLVSADEMDEYESGRLQVNFIAMNRIDRGDQAVDKAYDALGDRSPTGLSEYLSIPLNVNQIYRNDSNAQGILEPSRDVAEPRLDIVDWTVEVRED